MNEAYKERGRLLAIDLLRGLAVFMVLIRHLPYSLNLAPSMGGKAKAVDALPEFVTAVTDYGEFGVHLFLVISGFCIHQRWAKRGDEAIGLDFISFWKRRLVRLYPPYFVALLLSLGGLFVLFGVLGHAKHAGIAGMFGYANASRMAIDLSLLLILLHNLNGAHHRIGNPPFWSLALEEQLYMLYFGLLSLRRKHGWTLALIVSGVVTIGWRAIGVGLGQSRPNFWSIVGPAHWFSWALGALAVEAHLGRVRLPEWTRSWSTLVAAFGVAVLFHPPKTMSFRIPGAEIVDDILFAFAFFILVNVATSIEKRGALPSWRIFAAFTSLGVVSYSVYLTHLPLMVAVKQVALRLGLSVPITLVLRLAIPIALGYLFYKLIESPFIRKSRGVQSSHSSSSSG